MVSVFEQCKARVEYGKASAEKWWKAGASRPTGRRTFLETVSIVAQMPRRGIKKKRAPAVGEEKTRVDLGPRQ